MKVTTSWRDRVLVAALDGEIDTFDTEGLGEALEQVARADAAGVVLDFRGVQYIASMGIGMLVNVARQVRAHGMQVRIAGASPAVHTVLNTVGLATVLPMDATVEEAVENLAGVANC